MYKPNYCFKIVPFCALLLSLFLLQGCSTESDYKQAFKIVKSEAILKPGATKKDSLRKIQLDAFFSKEAFINFCENDSLSVLNAEGMFALGKWKGNANIADFEINLNEIGPISFLKNEEKDENDKFEYLVLKSEKEKGLDINLLLKKDAYFKSSKVDLLKIPLNWWRIKPTKKENKAQIKKRVLAQIDYMINYFELISDNNYRSFQTQVIVCPYKLFANGIGIDPSLLSEYNKIFYDYNDAEIAYQMLLNGLNSVSVYPADKESYTKGYFNVLKKIRKTIELL
jgi:hypothetical protein